MYTYTYTYCWKRIINYNNINILTLTIDKIHLTQVNTIHYLKYCDMVRWVYYWNQSLEFDLSKYNNYNFYKFHETSHISTCMNDVAAIWQIINKLEYFLFFKVQCICQS